MTSELTKPDIVTHDSQSTKRSKLGLIGLAVTGGLAAGLTVITASFVSPALRKVCLPYVPATEKQIANALQLCRKTKKPTTFVDLGSGDGRIVFAAARAGFQAVGYELNPWLVLYSKISARMRGLENSAKFHRKDLWKVDLKNYDNIIIFGVADMMDDLSLKLENEMKHDARVIACRFEVQRWKPVEEIEEGIDSAWLYTKNSFVHAKSF